MVDGSGDGARDGPCDGHAGQDRHKPQSDHPVTGRLVICLGRGICTGGITGLVVHQTVQMPQRDLHGGPCLAHQVLGGFLGKVLQGQIKQLVAQGNSHRQGRFHLSQGGLALFTLDQLVQRDFRRTVFGAGLGHLLHLRLLARFFRYQHHHAGSGIDVPDLVQHGVGRRQFHVAIVHQVVHA